MVGFDPSEAPNFGMGEYEVIHDLAESSVHLFSYAIQP